MVARCRGPLLTVFLSLFPFFFFLFIAVCRDTVKDWFHALSGGQKQRVAMARLFYHRVSGHCDCHRAAADGGGAGAGAGGSGHGQRCIQP